MLKKLILHEAIDLEVISIYIILESIKVLESKKVEKESIKKKKSIKDFGFSSFLLSYGP